ASSGSFSLTITRPPSTINGIALPQAYMLKEYIINDLPSIAVMRNNEHIINDGSENISSCVAETPTQLDYLILNNGSTVLNLELPIQISDKSNCNVSVVSPASQISPLGQSAFSLLVTPLSAGNFSFKVSITSNDANSNPFFWTVQGTARELDPILTVRRNESIIANNSTEDIGDCYSGYSQNIEYSVSNDGGSNLQLGASTIISSITNCSVQITKEIQSPISKGVGVPLIIKVAPSAPGAFSCKVTLTSNAPATPLYEWTISGNAISSSARIFVYGNDKYIPDNSTQTSTSDLTDFGHVVINSYSKQNTYKIANLGGSPLILEDQGQNKFVTISGPQASGFTVSSQPEQIISVGSTANFTITFSPIVPGINKATVKIMSNDTTTPEYTFDITGFAIKTVYTHMVDSNEDNMDYDTSPGEYSLREAVFLAQEGDTIGFKTQGPIELNSEILIDKALNVIADAPVTISGKNACRIFRIQTNGGKNVSLTGLILKDGNGESTVSNGHGGAIYLYRDNLTLSNCVLQNNSATGNGGAICADQGVSNCSLTLSDCTISGNTATGHGGGIYSQNTCTMNRVTISGNTAT
ncbi:MAG: choice-of-anchor D domain-containing protein, partial [Candidatus Nanoarchaeia archaeon]